LIFLFILTFLFFFISADRHNYAKAISILTQGLSFNKFDLEMYLNRGCYLLCDSKFLLSFMFYFFSNYDSHVCFIASFVQFMFSIYSCLFFQFIHVCFSNSFMFLSQTHKHRKMGRCPPRL